MKKIKLVFIALALVAGVGGAFATRPAAPCEGFQQYWTNGMGSYIATVGDYGVGWYCEYTPAETCTYWRPNPMQPNYYEACTFGVYHAVFREAVTK